MITLYAYREQSTWWNTVTTLKDDKGRVKAIFDGKLRQPKYGTKVLTVNCNKFSIDWSNVVLIKR